MSAELRRVVVTFRPDGIELAVTYAHTGELPAPGSKGRTKSAATLAARGLEAALEGLDKGGASLLWGGFGQGSVEATDHVLIERKKERAA